MFRVLQTDQTIRIDGLTVIKRNDAFLLTGRGVAEGRKKDGREGDLE